MARLPIQEVLDYVQCPYCSGAIIRVEHGVQCSSCGRTYRSFNGNPVLIREENELFPASAYGEDSAVTTGRSGRITRHIKQLVPSPSVNLARRKMLNRLFQDHGNQHKRILVVGSGNQPDQLQKLFPCPHTVFIFCDIDKRARVDVYCDAHDLSFKTALFDGVVSTAVVEHVLYPERVMGEMHRVLKPGGFLYSEIPFLQSVHEGAYDFTRYTMSGHRRLCEMFEEVDSGMVAGPGTALVWSIAGFCRAMFSSPRLSAAAALLSRVVFFWIKYFDYLLAGNPRALDSASCTYFYGQAKNTRSSARSIVKKYASTGVEHI